MNATQRTICVGLVLAVTACGRTLRAEESNREFALGVNAANATLRGGDVDGALKQYGEIRSTAPESADLSYNMAVAQYRKGEVAAAAPLFEAAATSENDSLAANARYNLGNCDYTAGLKLAETDRKAAIKELEAAIGNYRNSLAVDTNNADARTNIELAAQLIDKLREEEKQQEQQQNQQQKRQDQQQSENQEQNDQQQQGSQGKQDEQQQDEQKQSEKQQNQQKQSGEQQEKDQEQKDSQSESSQGGENQQQEQEQQKQQKKKEQDQKSADEQNPDQQQKQQESQQQNEQSRENKQQHQSQSQSQQKKSQSAQQQQQQPKDSQDAGSPEEQQKEQQDEKPPKGDLSAANEEEANKNEKREAVAFDPSKDGEMTQQEAEKMLQAIRDRDLIRRYNRQQNEQQNYVPVDRDW